MSKNHRRHIVAQSLIPLPRFRKNNELPHPVTKKIVLPRNDAAGEQSLLKSGPSLIPLRIRIVGNQGTLGNQRVII
jgi:hypothetical protein